MNSAFLFNFIEEKSKFLQFLHFIIIILILQKLYFIKAGFAIVINFEFNFIIIIIIIIIIITMAAVKHLVDFKVKHYFKMYFY